jgi:peptide/nickel transport system substrate-binding protein
MSAMVAMLVAGAMIVTLGACGGKTQSTAPTNDAARKLDTTPASKGGTLRLARSIEPVTLNPFICPCENGSLQTMAQIYDTVVEFMPGTSDAKPGLATRWDASPDKKTFTFHLRDAKFSDGSPVTSTDVKYTLDRVNTPKNLYYGMYGVIKRVSAPDRATVVVTLKRSTPGFPWYLGFPAAAIVSKAALEKVGDKAFGQQPVGSGAFMLKRWIKGQVVELVRNPHYWRAGQPYLDAVKMLYVPNDNTRTLDLLSGSVDAVDAVPFSQVKQVDNSGKAKVLFQLSSGMYNVWFNESYKPLNELAVRQALNYATPVTQIQKVVFGGLPEIMNANMPKLKYWSAKVKPYTYDVDRAKQLLAKSTRPNGFNLTIELVSGDETSKQVAQILQDSWAKLGVKVALRQFDLGTLNTRVANYQHQAYMTLPDIYTSDLPIPDEFANILFNAPGTRNAWTWHNDPVATRLTDRAIHATNESQQAELFAQLQQRTMDDPSSVPLIFPPYRAAARSNVKGFQYVQTGWWRLEQVSIKR